MSEITLRGAAAFTNDQFPVTALGVRAQENWEYVQQIGQPEVSEERREGFYEYIWRIFCWIITCKMFSESMPVRMVQGWVKYDVIQTFRCRDTQRASFREDVQRLYAHLRAPYDPIPQIMGLELELGRTFVIQGKRTMNNGVAVDFEYRILRDGAVILGRGEGHGGSPSSVANPSVPSFAHLMEAGRTFTLLEYENHPLHVNNQCNMQDLQLKAALKWVAPDRDYIGLISGIRPATHSLSGYWTVRLNEDPQTHARSLTIMAREREPGARYAPLQAPWESYGFRFVPFAANGERGYTVTPL